MYGQIHLIVRELILTKYGDDKWQEILCREYLQATFDGLNKKSKLDAQNDFLTFQRYDDVVTNTLLDAVSFCLGVPMDKVLELFGCHFLVYSLGNGYDKMLRTLGGNMFTFIQNLDSLHALLKLSYNASKTPSFRCSVLKNGNIKLHYFSQRMGLYHIVIGLVEAVGRELFSQKVKVSIVKENIACFKGVATQHCEFLVELLSAEGSLGDESSSTSMDTCEVLTPRQASKYKDSMLKAADFCRAFPYHMVFDEKLRILQVGDSVRRLTDIKIKDGMHISGFGEIVSPAIEHDLKTISMFINAVFVINIFRHKHDKSSAFPLKGQMLWLERSSVLIFVGSPRLTSLNELIEVKMFLADIPIHDVTRELVLLNQQRIAEIDVAKQLDETTTMLLKTSADLVIEKKRTEDLLHQLLPEKVALQLIQGKGVEAEKFECVTVLFSDIVAFTSMASACSPMNIISTLNELYRLFDSRSSLSGVYKVETIGDAYMVVAGAPVQQEDHAERVAVFAMDILREAGKVISPVTGMPLQIRVGIHSGPVVSGVVGKKMPRYCLFGDTVNVTSKMECGGSPGRIHLSSSTFDLLYPYGFTFKDRGAIDVKGKGAMHTYFLTAFAGRTTVQPEDEFLSLPDLVHPKPLLRVRKVSKRPENHPMNINLFKMHQVAVPHGSSVDRPDTFFRSPQTLSSSAKSQLHMQRKKSTFCLLA